MRFELMPQSWHKRRSPGKEPELLSFEVRGFTQVENSRCLIIARFDDGTVHHLDARVCYNELANRWTAHGMNPSGISVLLKLVE